MLPSPSITKHNGVRVPPGSLGRIGAADGDCSGFALMVLVGVGGRDEAPLTAARIIDANH